MEFPRRWCEGLKFVSLLWDITILNDLPRYFHYAIDFFKQSWWLAVESRTHVSLARHACFPMLMFTWKLELRFFCPVRQADDYLDSVALRIIFWCYDQKTLDTNLSVNINTGKQAHLADEYQMRRNAHSALHC